MTISRLPLTHVLEVHPATVGMDGVVTDCRRGCCTKISARERDSSRATVKQQSWPARRRLGCKQACSYPHPSKPRRHTTALPPLPPSAVAEAVGRRSCALATKTSARRRRPVPRAMDCDRGSIRWRFAHSRSCT